MLANNQRINNQRKHLIPVDRLSTIRTRQFHRVEIRSAESALDGVPLRRIIVIPFDVRNREAAVVGVEVPSICEARGAVAARRAPARGIL